MKLPRHIGRIVGMGIILIMFIYIMATNLTDNFVAEIAWLLLAILMVYSGYRRHYHVYRLEKLQDIHDKEDYVKYFDDMNLFAEGIKNFVIPTPILKELNSIEENQVRLTINRLTYLFYASAVGFFVIGGLYLK